MSRVECRCGGGGLHSCYKHEPTCPVYAGWWCEDCGHSTCVCGPSYIPSPRDEWWCDVETEQWTTKDGEKRSAAKLNLRGIGRVLQEQGAARATRSPAPADDPFGSAPVADEAPF